MNHFLDVALADEIGDELEDFLIDLDRDHVVVLDDGKDVIDVVFKHFDIVFAELQDFVEHDNFNVVVIVLLKKVEVALNRNFDGAWGCRQLGDCVCALKKD